MKYLSIALLSLAAAALAPSVAFAQSKGPKPLPSGEAPALAPGVAIPAVTTVTPPSAERASNDPYESPNSVYHFIGARYRGTVIPQFMLNLAVSEGTTVYSNSIGIEYERRSGNFSIIPALSYTEYSMDSTLFLEKGKPEATVGNWSLINSSMKAIYGSVDFLWSKKLSKTLDFEYGFGVGLGAFFDNLSINWVYRDPNGKYGSANGQKFSACTSINDGAGCTARDHSNSKELKVNGYQEPSWFNGGSKPNFFPTITIPNVGLRFKPSRAFAARAQVGFSVTGFWFGLSGSYGFPGKAVTRAPKNDNAVEVEETVE
jgi:hypothetical protein